MAYKGWKKVHSAADHSILENPQGHQLKVAHSALSPKMRGQLAEIPLEKAAGAKQSAVEDSNPASKAAIGKNKGMIKMSSGGITQAQNRQSIADTINGAPKATGGENIHQVKQSESQSSGPETPDTSGIAETQAANQSDPSKADALAKTNAARSKFLGLAKGGVVRQKFADGTPDGPIPDPTDVVPGVPQAASNPTAYDFEQKKSQIAQSNMNQPNPEAADFDTTNKALDQIDGEKRAGAQAAAAVGADAGAAYQARVDQNKRLEAAGLPIQPLPPPPASAPADTNPGAPDGGMAAAGQGPGADQSNNDPYGTQVTSDSYMSGLKQAQQGIAGEARAAGNLGNEQAKIAHDQAVNKQNLMDTYQNEVAAGNKQRAEFMDAMQNQKIDPNHYMGSMDTGQRIQSAIGLILGGMGAGLTGGPNVAMVMLNQQIDRDIDAQKANNMREAMNTTRAMMTDMAASKFQEAAGKNADPAAKARALQAVGQLNMQSAAQIGQNARMKAMLQGAKDGKVAPASIVEFAVPQADKPAARKELTDMQDAVSLRDNTLHAFDQIAKLNTLGNHIMNPIQAQRQIDAIQGPVLDKMTKDVSGRVTPETIKLVKGAFARMGNSPDTNIKARAALQALLSQGMHYPTLEAYHIGPDSLKSRFNSQGQSRIPTSAPVPNKKR
jgi:hypothetical protein